MPPLNLAKLIKTALFLAPVLAAAAGFGRAVASNADHLDETVRALKDTQARVERLDSQREEMRMQETALQSDLRSVREGVERIERRLGTK